MRIFAFTNLLWIMGLMVVAIWSYNIGSLVTTVYHVDELKGSQFETVQSYNPQQSVTSTYLQGSN